jgi:hypothetical protein
MAMVLLQSFFENFCLKGHVTADNLEAVIKLPHRKMLKGHLKGEYYKTLKALEGRRMPVGEFIRKFPELCEPEWLLSPKGELYHLGWYGRHPLITIKLDISDWLSEQSIPTLTQIAVEAHPVCAENRFKFLRRFKAGPLLFHKHGPSIVVHRAFRDEMKCPRCSGPLRVTLLTDFSPSPMVILDGDTAIFSGRWHKRDTKRLMDAKQGERIRLRCGCLGRRVTENELAGYLFDLEHPEGFGNYPPKVYESDPRRIAVLITENK